MSLFDLKRLISNEDFADAHEPVNDGVKEVPNAQTIAAEVGKGDVGQDTTSAGPAKVIPEKEDTDDNTEKQFDTVSESAEKGGSDSKPAPKAPTAKPDDTTSGDSDTGSKTEEDAGSKSDYETEGKAPPFVKKEDTEESEVEEPLEHDSKEAAEDEKKKTDDVTKSLEKYVDRAKQFDVIGYPRADRDHLQKRLNWLSKRTGGESNVTISAESISALVEAGQARSVHLAKQVELHTQRKVSTENYDAVVEQAITEQPTEHGNPPLSPEEATGLTEREINALDVDVTGITQVQDAIQTLQGAQVAIEQHLQILRSNKRISKQAAAVLQAGLEHIDQVCRLKVRVTGLEGYDTTPRASLEDAEVSEKSLLDRAGELGAKILKWLRELVSRAGELWEKYRNGLSGLRDKADELRKSKFKTGETVTLSPAPMLLFQEGKFVGTKITDEELQLAAKIDAHYKKLTNEVTRRVVAMLGKQNVGDTDLVMEALRDEDGEFSKLPGDKWIGSEGGKLVLIDGTADAPESYEVKADDVHPSHMLRNIVTLIDRLLKLDTVELLKKSTDTVTKELIKFRKGAGKDMDEAEFQRIQQSVVDNSIKLFDVDSFFAILRQLGKIYSARYSLCAGLVAGKESSEE